MKWFKGKGWTIVIATILISLSIWIISKIVLGGWFSDNWKYLSKVAALSSTTMMAWIILMSARFRWVEDLFGGLDKVYQAHKKLGIYSFFLILLHPISLALHHLPSLGNFISHLGLQSWHGNYRIGFNLGWLALALMTLLIWLSTRIKIPYHLWKKTHEYFGVVWGLIGLHIVLVSKDVAAYPVLSVWIYGIYSCALLSYIYMRFFYRIFGPRYDYIISDIEKFEDSAEITLTPKDAPMNYFEGQFIYLRLQDPRFKDTELHPFSIASQSCGNGEFKLGIKKLGDFTSGICTLEIGDSLDIYGPYGRFSEKYQCNDRPSVFIAGGIGVTPFMGMWQKALETDMLPTVFFYCAKTVEDATFLNDVERIAIGSQYKGFETAKDQGHYFELINADEKGYLTFDRIQSVCEDVAAYNIIYAALLP
jgi:predicted ferric reductase